MLAWMSRGQLSSCSLLSTSFTIARCLPQDGAHVAISSRKQQNVDSAVAKVKGEGLSMMGTVCHVGKAEDGERLVEYEGGVGFLVCTAGVNTPVGSTLGPLHKNKAFWNLLKKNHQLKRQAAQYCPSSVTSFKSFWSEEKASGNRLTPTLLAVDIHWQQAYSCQSIAAGIGNGVVSSQAVSPVEATGVKPGE
ncbi:Dehydrogenase/reductase SDR family member 2 [Fukomys damarensis]|uniref:Dehydrogenase/reductase SDR family member 2 n=1 Tax=Fukomys damarensis TaxID=885580 RepID=A0A091DXD6_FUKDA|nr:Dehydrogenase/reductase SDR family member 2 [Fukomys damarensis]